MKTNDIQKIEQTLKIKLPRHYINFQLNYPNELRELNFNKELLSDDSDWLIQINKLLRTGNLPENLFVIGMDLGGNFYFIKISEDEEIVYYHDHEEASESDEDTQWEDILSPDHQNLNEYKNWLIEFYGDILTQ